MAESIIAVFDADNDDFICIAKDYYSAVSYLLEHNYLNDNLQFFDWDTGNSVPLKSFFPNYKEIILNEWDINKFNTFFCDDFRLEKVNIFIRCKGE